YPLAEQTAEHEEFPHLGRPVSRLIRPTDLEKARHLSTSANAPWHRLLMYARLRPWFRFFVDAQTSGESIHGEQPIGTMGRCIDLLGVPPHRTTRRFVCIGLSCSHRLCAEWAAPGNEPTQQLSEHVLVPPQNNGVQFPVSGG